MMAGRRKCCELVKRNMQVKSKEVGGEMCNVALNKGKRGGRGRKGREGEKQRLNMSEGTIRLKEEVREWRRQGKQEESITWLTLYLSSLQLFFPSTLLPLLLKLIEKKERCEDRRTVQKEEKKRKENGQKVQGRGERRGRNDERMGRKVKG